MNESVLKSNFVRLQAGEKQDVSNGCYLILGEVTSVQDGHTYTDYSFISLKEDFFVKAVVQSLLIVFKKDAIQKSTFTIYDEIYEQNVESNYSNLIDVRKSCAIRKSIIPSDRHFDVASSHN